MKKKGLILITLSIIFVLTLAFYFILSNHSSANTLTLYGNVDIRDVNLSFRVNGRLMDLYVDEGDTVHKGKLIARLDPEPYLRQLASAKALVSQQKASFAYAQTVYEREKKLYGTGASSVDRYQNSLTSRDAAQAGIEKVLADLSQANLNLEDTYLYSPSEGMVLTRAVEPGTMLTANVPVITLSLVNPVWVRAYISEINLSQAKQGTKVSVYSDSHPDAVYWGQIGFVSPSAEFTPKNVETTDLRTQLVYRLRIIVQDPQQELRQGMPVTVKLLIKESQDAKKSQDITKKS